MWVDLLVVNDNFVKFIFVYMFVIMYCEWVLLEWLCISSNFWVRLIFGLFCVLFSVIFIEVEILWLCINNDEKGVFDGS